MYLIMDNLKNIVIQPYVENKNIKFPQWLMYDKLLSKDLCEKIIELSKKLPLNDGTIFSSDNKLILDKIRKSKVRWIKKNNKDFIELFDFMNRLIRIVNEGFKVNCNDIESFQFTEYSEIGSKYDWHHDINWNRTDDKSRKISFIIQLSDPNDYEGGNFEFRYYENPNKDKLKNQGTILTFLPYQEHRVTPIVSGCRYSLVGWYEGPRWI